MNLGKWMRVMGCNGGVLGSNEVSMNGAGVRGEIE